MSPSGEYLGADHLTAKYSVAMQPATQQRYRSFTRRVLALSMTLAFSQLVTACVTQPPEANTRIDRLYRDAGKLLDRSSSSQPVDFSGLAGEINALTAADLSRDPCLAKKKARLAPILLSLAVIDGIPDQNEKLQLQGQARQRLLTLGDPSNQPKPGDFCYGRGFPRLPG